ncbi:MAG: phosphatase PAP2 family protein [Pseudomonadota bacterium]
MMQRTQSDDLLTRPAAWGVAGGASIVLVAIGYLFLDQPLSRFAHTVIGRHDMVRAFQTYPQYLSQLSVVLIVVLGLVRVFRGALGRLSLTAFAAGLSLVCASTIGNHLKYVFGRTWPETFVQNNPSFIQDGVYGFFSFHGGEGWASFPSGHTLAAVSFLTVPAIAYPRARVACGLLVLLEALALWAQNYHFFSDIVAGACLGGAVALVTARLMGLDGRKLG